MKTNKVIVFAGYRDWSKTILENLVNILPDIHFVHAETPENLSSALAKFDVEFTILAGWSWILDSPTLETNLVIGLHPSDLPDYAGGSPIQHQIIDGIIETKLSLFQITPELDQGPILLKYPLSLAGHMEDVFSNLASSGTALLTEAIPKVIELHKKACQQVNETHEEAKVLKRLTPQESLINKHEFSSFSTKKLFNLIRAREAPYPNAYIEDEHGKLYIQRVEFEPKT